MKECMKKDPSTLKSYWQADRGGNTSLSVFLFAEKLNFAGRAVV